MSTAEKKTFVDMYIRDKTKPEPDDRRLYGEDYVALTKIAHELVEEKWDELSMIPWSKPEKANPAETGKFDTDEQRVILRRLRAPFESAIWGFNTDQIKDATSAVMVGDGDPAENFKELKTRLHVLMDGVAEAVGHNAKHESWGKEFTVKEIDKLQQIYTEIAQKMIDKVDAYKQLTSVDAIVGKGFTSPD